MLPKQGLIAVDWGTTNRRVFVFDPEGRVIDRFADGAGVLSIRSEEFPSVITMLREQHRPVAAAIAQHRDDRCCSRA